ncbi:MAG: zinc-dependent peptidase [Phycisphaerae bacterium]|nr:zinc-dependent peptidase [Phycisphaerae bacterium]
MLLRWFRRRRIHRTPFPPGWRVLLDRHMRFWSTLTADEQGRMEDELRFFIAERNWEGCNGLVLTESMQAIIAAQACRLLLGRPEDRFGNVSTILVYPSGYVAGPPQTSTLPGGRVQVLAGAGMPVLGQAHERGPVILSWSHTLAGAIHDQDGNNLVLHEFAHKLDMANGAIDGTPRMSSAKQAREWHEAMTTARQRLVHDLQIGLNVPLRPYALTNPGEFFAVATEVFFERPGAMQEWDAELYRVMAEWYRQDPVGRDEWMA